jgi:hypothetical protein
VITELSFVILLSFPGFKMSKLDVNVISRQEVCIE